MISSLFEYYRLTTSDKDDDSCYKFTRVNEEDITICGYTIKEVITKLNSIDKAIEYIEEYKRLNWYEDSKHFYNVLDILKGSDKE